MIRQESSDQWHFWSSPSAEVLKQLDSGSKGLSGDEARRRHLRDAHLLLKPKSRLSTYELLFRQFTSPIILILLAALLCIVAGYVVAAEAAKKVFYRRVLY